MKKIIISLVVAALFPFLSSAQSNFYHNVLRVIVDDSLIMPHNGRPSSVAAFNTLIQQSSITYIDKPFHFAKTKELKNCYELYTSANLDSLINRLVAFAKTHSGQLLSIERIPKTIHYNSTPSDYFWSITDSTSYMWYLKKIQADKAWDITKGDTSVKVAIVDSGIDITHPDLVGKVDPPYDFYSGLPFPNDSTHFVDQKHGTGLATLVAGETADSLHNANGQMPSIGWKTKVMFSSQIYNSIIEIVPTPNPNVTYHFGRNDLICLYASTVKKVRVINVSWWYTPKINIDTLFSVIYPQGVNSYKLIEKEILDNGTSIVRAAGNYSELKLLNHPDACHCPLYPFSGSDDDRTIVVSGTDFNDKHLIIHNGQPYNHSHYPEVDLCAPSYSILCGTSTKGGANTWPYSASGGTSQSTPLVVGTIALMYAINPCLAPSSVQDILKQTTDPIADASSFPGLLGTGRLNAFKAVRAAKEAHSTSLDLFVKDRTEDLGNELYPYHWQAPSDQSPDIWVRNQDDGLTNRTHQNPEYTSGQPVYVYVRVRNKSCATAGATDSLRLHWTKAATSTSWPQNWDGSEPLIGNKLGAKSLQGLKPGCDTILKFTWNILNPNIHNNWASCLLARISSTTDGMNANYPAMDIYHNNNLALRNCHVVDVIPGMRPNGVINEVAKPFGSYIFVGNGESQATAYDISFVCLDSLAPLHHVAEIKLFFDEDGWAFFQPLLSKLSNVKQVGDKQVILTDAKCELKNVLFGAKERYPIYVGFSFMNENLDADRFYAFDVQTHYASTGYYCGGEHFTVNSYARAPFDANAGADKTIDLGQSVTISADQIAEAAVYYWYDTEGNLIYTGRNLSVSPEVSKKYKLEVVALSDGAKATDEVEVKINANKITDISPNPTSSTVTVTYHLENISTAYLMLLNETATVATNYLISTQSDHAELNVSNLPHGTYTAILICEGVATDAKLIVKQ